MTYRIKFMVANGLLAHDRVFYGRQIINILEYISSIFRMLFKEIMAVSIVITLTKNQVE
jgi:hypothetical protein